MIFWTHLIEFIEKTLRYLFPLWRQFAILSIWTYHLNIAEASGPSFEMIPLDDDSTLSIQFLEHAVKGECGA